MALSLPSEFPVEYTAHTSPFCLGVKRVSNDLCQRCDLHRVPRLARATDQPFLHTCHAGATELIVPIHHDNSLSAIAYIGQFRLTSQPARLPRLRTPGLRSLTGASHLLAAWLRERFADSSKPSTSRRHQIESFLAGNLSRSSRLSDLADFLSLSVTRTGHLVKAATGLSFIALRDRIRLDRARFLLASTAFNVSEIAAECGFSSSQHFHRFFRASTGTTPLVFRRDSPSASSV